MDLHGGGCRLIEAVAQAPGSPRPHLSACSGYTGQENAARAATAVEAIDPPGIVGLADASWQATARTPKQPR